MSRDPYYVVRDIANFANQFLRSETGLVEHPPGGPYPYFSPIHLIERDLACALRGFKQFYDEYGKLLSGSLPHRIPIGLRRAIDAVSELILTRQRRWGWDFVLAPDGMTRIRERLDDHTKTKKYPLLDAALSSAMGKNLPRHDGIDSLAAEAEDLEIQPTMTPEEGRNAVWDRHRDWFMSPALTEEIPCISTEEHGRLGDAVDELGRLFRRLDSPEKLMEYAESDKREETVVAARNQETGPSQVVESAQEPRRPPGAQNLATKELSLDDLTPTAWKLLKALPKQSAFNSDTAISREKLVLQAKIDNANSKNVRDACKDLTQMGLIASRRHVGTWVTQAGRDATKPRQ